MPSSKWVIPESRWSNTVLGGHTWSDGVRRTVEGIAEAQGIPVAGLAPALVRPASLVQRSVEPEEIASLVTCLTSPLSAATALLSGRTEVC